MRKVQCEECGKRYDFDEDDFCPRCGAFNPPARRENAAGNMQIHRPAQEETERPKHREQRAKVPDRRAGENADLRGKPGPKRGVFSWVWKVVLVLFAWQIVSTVLSMFFYW